MADFYTYKDAVADLSVAALNCAIMLAPYDAVPALTLESAEDGSLEIPAEYVSVGHFQKDAGVTFTNEIDSTEIEAYGEPEPIRTIISRRTTSIDFSMYQSQRNVLELFWAADFSNVTPSEFGGVVLEAPAVPKNRYYRAVVVGLDDRDGKEIWAYWLMPKVKLSDVDNQSLNDDGIIEYHPTLTAFKDDDLGYSVAQGFAGPGWRERVHQAGFAAPPTAITVTPGNVEVTAATGDNHTAQLLVVADNAINYTPDARFVSTDPSVAAVSASGLVTGVSAGSTSVQVSFTPADSSTALTDTVSVTVTA